MPAASLTPRTGPTPTSAAAEPPPQHRGKRRFVDPCACGPLVFAVFPFPRTGHVDHSDPRSKRSRSRALPEADQYLAKGRGGRAATRDGGGGRQAKGGRETEGKE